MMMLNKLLIGLLAVACVVMGFSFGVYYGQETFEPQYVDRVVRTDHYIQVEVEVVKEVEVIVEKHTELREFESLEELRDWLAKDGTSDVVYLVAGSDGVCRPSDKYDCDDYAADLQKAAADDGYLMSIQIDMQKSHAHNSVFIGNEIYFIEPQSDEVWLAGHRD